MGIPIAQAQSRWRRFRLAETDASDHASAACYSLLENVGVHAIVVAELKFRDVQRHVFGAHFVERADNAALEDRPETLDCVSVDRADDVLTAFVVHGLMRACFSG